MVTFNPWPWPIDCVGSWELGVGSWELGVGLEVDWMLDYAGPDKWREEKWRAMHT